MGDPSTYSLIDFFPFLPEVYFRLFVRLNQNVWPAHLLTVLAGLGALWLAWRGRGRWVGVILCAGWALVGWAYHLDMYANLNWAGTYFGWAFVAQGAILLAYGLLGRLDRQPDQSLGGPGWMGLALAVFGLVIYPLLIPLTGRQWAGVEVFGIAPNPTAIATLGLVLLARRTRWLLLLIPVLWSVVAGATAWAMEWPAGLVVPACALVALVAAVWKSIRAAQ